MFDDEMPEFAVQGEKGIDLFQRLDDEGQRRARFRCIATLAPDGTLNDHAPEARRDPARLRALAGAMAGDPLLTPFSLGDPRGWPRAAAGGDPVRLFLYLEFFRAWQVANLGGARFEVQLARDATPLPSEPGQIAGSVASAFDFNQLGRGVRLATALVPRLAARIAAPGYRDDRHGSTGYALRMLGDLCLRAGEAAQALAAFETALAAGDNPFRRRKAIEAARALGDAEALARHRALYAARWPLPADLKDTGDAA